MIPRQRCRLPNTLKVANSITASGPFEVLSRAVETTQVLTENHQVRYSDINIDVIVLTHGRGSLRLHSRQ